MSATTLSLTDRLKAQALALGFEAAGAAELRPSDHAELYRAWIAAERHGTMGYLAREDAVEARLDPRTRWPTLRSALVVTLRYATNAEEEVAADRGVVARYARGRDYHKVMKKKLLALVRWLEAETGRRLEAARAYVDTGPVLERELAQRAGLGWQGRNTMLLHPRRGSYFFIGTLLTELELEPDAPFGAEHCGTCNACVSACPTGALLGRDERGAPIMDATRCISYLTIENRGAIPVELRPLIGNRIFGCDICQEVCPWNAPKFVQITMERDFSADWREAAERPKVPANLPATESPSLVELMQMSREQWDVWTRGSAIRRAGYVGLLRNVAVALGNQGDAAAVPILLDALSDVQPTVRGHAAWALGRIGGVAAVSALQHALTCESDPAARAELMHALRVPNHEPAC